MRWSSQPRRRCLMRAKVRKATTRLANPNVTVAATRSCQPWSTSPSGGGESSVDIVVRITREGWRLRLREQRNVGCLRNSRKEEQGHTKIQSANSCGDHAVCSEEPSGLSPDLQKTPCQWWKGKSFTAFTNGVSVNSW